MRVYTIALACHPYIVDNRSIIRTCSLMTGLESVAARVGHVVVTAVPFPAAAAAAAALVANYTNVCIVVCSWCCLVWCDAQSE